MHELSKIIILVQIFLENTAPVKKYSTNGQLVLELCSQNQLCIKTTDFSRRFLHKVD